MKKITISKLFLYRYRFVIGYILLGLAFVGLILYMPNISPNGISEAEMESVVSSTSLHRDSILNGDLVDLPYRFLQKYSIEIFGLSLYSIKLPSIIFGILLGLLLILLLNRWFKSNVALFASIITILSSPFLLLSGTGTPLIMLVFWPTFLLWLGSKIQGVKRPKPAYCAVFAIALLLSIFTPHLIYLAAFIIIFALLQPHLRFTVKNLPKSVLIVTGLAILCGIAALSVNIIKHPNVAAELLYFKNGSNAAFFDNLSTGLAPLFAWNRNLEGVFLSPLIGLASFALTIIGLISTTRGFFASRNSIASYLIFFTIILTGFRPDAIVLIILPLSILIAHGLRYILEKWYSLFPENPYARIFAIVPITILLAIIILSDINHYIYGYRYNPSVANFFQNDVALIRENLTNETLLLEKDSTEYNFYKLLEKDTDIKVEYELPEGFTGKFASLNTTELPSAKLINIICSPKSENSARIYLYEIPGQEEPQQE